MNDARFWVVASTGISIVTVGLIGSPSVWMCIVPSIGLKCLILFPLSSVTLKSTVLTTGVAYSYWTVIGFWDSHCLNPFKPFDTNLDFNNETTNVPPLDNETNSLFKSCAEI